jgi:hypothetical protein
MCCPEGQRITELTPVMVGDALAQGDSTSYANIDGVLDLSGQTGQNQGHKIVDQRRDKHVTIGPIENAPMPRNQIP